MHVIFKAIFSVHWLVLRLINNTRDWGITAGVKGSGRTTCLCVPSCISFWKAPNGPTGDVILSQHQCGHNYTPESMMLFATWSFSVSMAGLNCSTGCVLTGQTLKRINVHMCNPWETTNHHGLRWRKTNFCNCSILSRNLVPKLFEWSIRSAILVRSFIPAQVSAAIEWPSEKQCSRRGCSSHFSSQHGHGVLLFHAGPFPLSLTQENNEEN